VPYDEVMKRFLSGLPKWEKRITEKGLPELSKPELKHYRLKAVGSIAAEAA